MFARGAPEDLTEIDRSRLALDVAGLVRAYSPRLRRSAGRAYLPSAPADAVDRQGCAAAAGGPGRQPAGLEHAGQFLPEALGTPMERRGALASTLIAGLELARGGALRLRQEAAFGPILVRRGAAEAEMEAPA